MSRFNYVAKGPHGTIQGSVDAASASAAASEIQAKGLVPLTIKQDGPVAVAATASAPVKMPDFMQPKVTQMDVMLFAKQLYTLFKAGVPMLRALAGLQETTQNPTMKVVLQDLRRALEGGVDLSTAMAQHP